MDDQEITASDVASLSDVVDVEDLPFGHNEGEVKGPDPAKWGTLAERIESGANWDSGDHIGQPVVDLSDIPEDEHDQYIVKGPDPAEHPRGA